MKCLTELDPARFESPKILHALVAASRSLAELKGTIDSIPNQSILISTLTLQEAKDSSEIENIITTHHELFQTTAFSQSAESKEVKRYAAALHVGMMFLKNTGLITIRNLIEIQQELLGSRSGIRTVSGTTLQNNRGQVVYTPPQDHDTILKLLADLEKFINDDQAWPADPILKMALIHHQFESIHPFYDGNGRTGRILNTLYLVKCDMLDIPVLYLSRPILQNKNEYYRLLHEVRDNDAWEVWVLFMLRAVHLSSEDAIRVTKQILKALLETKSTVRSNHKFYSQDLINHLFTHPYTTISSLSGDLKISRITAKRYLEAMRTTGIIEKISLGKRNAYVNTALWKVITSGSPSDRPYPATG